MYCWRMGHLLPTGVAEPPLPAVQQVYCNLYACSDGYQYKDNYADIFCDGDCDDQKCCDKCEDDLSHGKSRENRFLHHQRSVKFSVATPDVDNSRP